MGCEPYLAGFLYGHSLATAGAHSSAPLYCDADHALARLQQLGLLLRLVVSDTHHPAEKQLTQ